MNSKKIVIVLLVLLVIIVAWFYKSHAPSVQKYTTVNTPTEELKKINPDFDSGNAFRNQGNYAQALVSYQQSLAKAQDSTQEAQIKFDIALMTESLGKYPEAIAQYKQIAANSNYYSIVRAYSVQQLGRMYYSYFNPSGADMTIPNETFKDEPYASFKKDADYTLAYRKLFEYSADIYPLALAEGYVANWYSRNLVQDLKGATTSPEGKADINQVNQRLEKADADIERTKKDPTAMSTFSSIFSREATVVGDMASVGVPGYTYARAENLYKKGIQFTAAMSQKRGSFVVYNYAAFMATALGQSRAQDLHSLLTVFTHATPQTIDVNVINFLKYARTSRRYVGEKAKIIKMAKIDPDFKTYLISLGWHASDFSAS